MRRLFIILGSILLLALSACESGNCGSVAYRSPDRLFPSVSLTPVSDARREPVSEGVIEELRQEFERFESAPSIVQLGIATRGPSGSWESGSSDAQRYYWASVGKLATSILTLQLVQEGLLTLDDRLQTWYPDLPRAGEITIEMLLSHRSGLPSHNEFEEFRNRTTAGTTEDVVRFLREQPLLFCPGTNWYYSNSGYMILGRILERVTGVSYARLIEQRIALVLNTPSLQALAAGDRPSDVAPIAPLSDEASFAPGDPFAAGNLVATPRDMLEFLSGALDGRLLAASSVEDATRLLYPMFDQNLYYGLGVMIYDTPEGLWLGHSGGVSGAHAVVAYVPSQDTFITVALTGQGSPESIARALLNKLSKSTGASR